MFLSPLLIVAAILAAAPRQTPPQPASPVPSVAIDIVTFPSTVLAPAELSVSVDGRPRKVVSVRPILRGPGSERVVPGATGGANAPVSEPSRTLIVAVDQNSLTRGSEKKMSSMIARVLDLIAPGDQAALIPLPLERTHVVAATTDRRAMWAALGRIRVGSGAAPLALARAEEPPPLPDDETHVITNPSGDDRPMAQPDRQREPVRRPDIPERIVERVPGPLDDMRGLLSGIRDVTGTKTILLIRGTTAPDGETREPFAGASRTETVALQQVAAAARVIVQVVTLGDRWRGSADDIARLARLTGGDEFRLGKQTDKELERLGVSLAEGLRIAVEGSPGDLDGRLHQVAIATSRREVVVRAPERWLPLDAHEPERIAAAPPSISAAGARPAVPAAAAAPAADSELQRVLGRMASYVAQYVQEFSSVVAEESYDQHVNAQGAFRLEGPRSRTLRSDFLLVQIPGTDDWTPFRDVFEVNGKPVRERDDRLRKLFIEMPPGALNKARQILDEGARYNIGSTYRNVNQPVLPLIFLKPQFIDGLRFRRAGEDGVEGVRAWRIDFEEVARPTVIRNDKADRDIPAAGSLWVDPITGRILKTRIRMRDASLRMETTVVYRRSDTLHMWAPAEMEELYLNGAERLTGSATYKNFRRFRIDVEERIAVPKE